MKTRVKITNDFGICVHNIGDEGYIDGYVMDKHGECYAVVIVGTKIDKIKLINLKVL